MRALRPFFVKWDRFSAASLGLSRIRPEAFGRAFVETDLPIENAIPDAIFSDANDSPERRFLFASGIKGSFAWLRFTFRLTLALPRA